jgi:DNA-binding transcriptional regulator GbsR (MarR family)
VALEAAVKSGEDPVAAVLAGASRDYAELQAMLARGVSAGSEPEDARWRELEGESLRPPRLLQAIWRAEEGLPEPEGEAELAAVKEELAAARRLLAEVKGELAEVKGELAEVKGELKYSAGGVASLYELLERRAEAEKREKEKMAAELKGLEAAAQETTEAIRALKAAFSANQTPLQKEVKAMKKALEEEGAKFEVMKNFLGTLIRCVTRLANLGPALQAEREKEGGGAEGAGGEEGPAGEEEGGLPAPESLLALAGPLKGAVEPR